MMSISPNSIARSSLEEMLDSLRRRDGSEKPKDVPPALPARPKRTSRARLPSAKRRLPSTFEAAEGQGDLNHIARKNNAKGRRRNSFGSKQIKEMLESPYVLVTSADRKHEPTSEEKDSTKLASSPQGSLPRFRDSECGDNLDYFIKKKLRVWCQRHNCLWESGQLQSTSGKKASVMLSDNKVVTVPTQELLPANPDILEGVDDLVQLSYLNEPSVLHNLQYRFSRDIIYSKTGPLLIAVNPFKDVQLCGNDLITAYRKKLLDNPHVFAVVDTAYNEIMREDINQSIIISGESGAGKTETAKVAMQYLAAIGGCSSGIESEVLQTSCVLEAFGNAKTSKNDNSSRFGKLIEIQFTAMWKICGAKIQTSLLEKSRVVQLARGDRSYHIFYQLCAGAPSGFRDRLRLKRARDYNYLKQSDCLEIQGVNDAQKFQMLMAWRSRA